MRGMNGCLENRPANRTAAVFTAHLVFGPERLKKIPKIASLPAVHMMKWCPCIRFKVHVWFNRCSSPSLNPATTSHTTTNPAKAAPSHSFQAEAASGLMLWFESWMSWKHEELSWQHAAKEQLAASELHLLVYTGLLLNATLAEYCFLRPPPQGDKDPTAQAERKPRPLWNHAPNMMRPQRSSELTCPKRSVLPPNLYALKPEPPLAAGNCPTIKQHIKIIYNPV